MITLEQIAKHFEDGLNAVYDNPNIQFSIAAHAGILRNAVREQNNVTSYITGSLSVDSSSNDANLLVMGANGLSLEFAIPAKRPRTTGNQAAEELQKIRNGQYPFVNEVMKAINDYFENAQAFTLTDGEDEYSLAFQAGTSMSDATQILEGIGECVIAYASITLYFIEGGIISKDVQITIDGARMPFQVVRVGRSSELSRDVYLGKYISKSIASSTAFAIDLQFPANADVATQETLAFLLGGTPNTAHFVTVQYGASAPLEIYLMTFDNVITNAQGVMISGATAALIEVVEITDALNFPAGYQVGKFTFQSSEYNSIVFTLSEECDFYLGGIAGRGTGAQTIELSPDDFVYDDENDVYAVYLVTNKAVGITSEIPFEVE